MSRCRRFREYRPGLRNLGVIMRRNNPNQFNTSQADRYNKLGTPSFGGGQLLEDIVTATIYLMIIVGCEVGYRIV